VLLETEVYARTKAEAQQVFMRSKTGASSSKVNFVTDDQGELEENQEIESVIEIVQEQARA
jgi:hypothetical protein